MITQEFLKHLFEYRDGILFWKNPPKHNSNLLGKEAGFTYKSGYKGVSIKGKHYKMHRIIFLMHHGFLPKELDHINGDKSDNRIENLRPCDRMQNNQNKGKQKNNKTGYKCVYKARNKYRAIVTFKNKTYDFGYFNNAEDAYKIVEEFKQKNHKEFYRKIV